MPESLDNNYARVGYFVARFIGAPSMNMLPATLDQQGVQLQTEQRVSTTYRSNKHSDILLGVRPDDLALDGPDEPLIRGTGMLREPLGAETLIYIDSGEQKIIAKADGRTPPEPGTQVTFSANAEDAAPWVVVKHGTEGPSALQAGQWLHDPALPSEVVDTTGAGDAFNSGFLVSWLRGDSLSKCLAADNHCGAVSVKSVGGIGGLVALRDSQ